MERTYDFDSLTLERYLTLHFASYLGHLSRCRLDNEIQFAQSLSTFVTLVVFMNSEKYELAWE